MPAFTARIHIILFTLLMASGANAAYNPTENYWQCLNKVDGEWDFGRAPYACNVSAFGAESYVLENYNAAIFVDSEDRTDERRRYMQELYAFIRDASEYYLLTRKPDVTNAEQSAWQHAVFAVAHQETFWSHYRTATDQRIKMIRGDEGHGHGMMQIDDRWHFVALNEGKGFELIENMIYALDIYYAEWQRSLDQACLDSETNWRDRARSAYSAYNGGSSKICRWIDPDDTFAQNDIGYAQKYDNQSWAGYVDDTEYVSPIDVECLAEGGSNCQQPGFGAWAGKLLKIEDSSACIYANEQLHCLDDERNATCLIHIADFDLDQVVQLTTSDIANVTTTEYNPHQICSDLIDTIHPVGSFIQLLQDNEILATPGSGKIADIPANFVLQVLDFQVENKQSLDRYYMISHNGQTGYINGGNSADTATWTAITTESPTEQMIPTTGQTIKIVPPLGINLRATPAGTLITAVPHNTELQVQSYVVRNNDNKIYYEVDYAGQSGFIYGGHIIEPPTIENWATLVEEDSQGGGGSSALINLILMALCTIRFKRFKT